MTDTLFRSRPQVEELEPRILFSADLGALALDSLPPAASEQRVLANDGEYAGMVSELRQELVVIDSTVQDYQTLLADILRQADNSRHIEVIILDANRDGVEQISQALRNYDNLDALHLISHGEAGLLRLGNDSLDTVGLNARSAAIAGWSLAFNGDADILLYGCDVAAGTSGAGFLTLLSQLTGTDVSASNDLTGNPDQGGDWILEAQTGRIETALLLGEQQTSWQGRLDITPLTADIPVNTVTSSTQATTPSSRQVAISPVDGSFVAVWTSDGQDGSGKGVYLRRFDGNGNPIDVAEIRVNTTTSNDQQTPAIAMAADGSFVVVWDSNNQDDDGHGIFGQRFDADANKIGGEFRVNSETEGDQTSPSIGMDAAGNFVVAWVSDDQDDDGLGVYAQRFNAGANKLGSEFRVNSFTNNNQYQPAVAMNASGAFVIVWTSERQDLGLDGFSDGVYGRLFDAAGTTVKGEFRINPVTFRNQYSPDVAMNDAGQFVVVLTDEFFGEPNIAAFVFNSAGNLQGFGTPVNQHMADKQFNPAVAMANSGDFIVAWESDKQDGDQYGIVARQFKSNYVPYANELLVNAYTRNQQLAPSIAWNNTEAVFLWSGENATDNSGIAFRLAAIGNTAPVITSNGGGNTAAIAIAENTTAVTTLTATDADLPAQPLSYSIIGGADQAKFNLDTNSGVLSFITAPNYEIKTDSNADNVYQVIVQVSDGKGGSDSQTINVTVTDVNEAPTAQNDVYATNQGTTLNVSVASGVLANDSDPESDALSVVDPALVTASHGTLTLAADGSFTYIPSGGYSGADSFSYTISDGNGHNSIGTVTINISPGTNNAPVIDYSNLPVLTPIAEDSGPRMITQAELLTNASDVDLLVATGLTIASGNGSLLNNGDGTWTYTPALNDYGNVTFTYVVSDGSLSADNSATLDITPVNDAPVAADTSINTDEDTVYNGNLPAASDVEGNTVSYSLNSQAAHGAAAINLNGSFSYTPNFDFTGNDSFSYTVSDGNGSNTYTVTVSVGTANDPPVANDDAYAGDEDTAITGVVLANDTDADGDTLTINVITGPSHGTLQWEANGSFSYTPNLNFSGSDSFTYQAIDSAGVASSNTATVVLTVNPVNDPPASSPVILTAIREDSGPRLITQAELLANASDVEGSTLTVSGLAISSGKGSLVDNGNGAWTYTPALHDSSSVGFSYRISDGSLAITASASLDIIPNIAPLAVNDSGSGAVNTVIQGNVLSNDSDAENDALTAVLVRGPNHGSLVLNSDGSFIYTPNAQFVGSDSFRYQARDASSAGNTAEVKLTVTAAGSSVTSYPQNFNLGGSGGQGQGLTQAQTSSDTNAASNADDTSEQTSEKEAAATVRSISADLQQFVGAFNQFSDVMSSDYLIMADHAATNMQNILQASASLNAESQDALPVSFNDALSAIIKNTNALDSLKLSLNDNAFRHSLDHLQKQFHQQLRLDKNVLTSALSVSTGLSVGYVIWLIRGGVLLSSVLSSLPAWRLIDPLPILGSLNRPEHLDDDDDSLEGILKSGNSPATPNPETDHEQAS